MQIVFLCCNFEIIEARRTLEKSAASLSMFFFLSPLGGGFLNKGLFFFNPDNFSFFRSI